MCLSLLQYVSATHPTLYNTDLLLSFSQRSLEKKKSFFQTENSHTFGIDPEIEHTSVLLKWSLFPLRSVQSACQHTLAALIIVNISVLAKAVTKGIFVFVYSSFWFLSRVWMYGHIQVYTNRPDGTAHLFEPHTTFAAVTSIWNQSARSINGVDI